MKAGIYQILNLQNGKRYIGSSVNTTRRMRVHVGQLRKRNHHSSKLQRAFDKYGEAAFVFQTLLVCTLADLLFYEQLLIDGYNAVSDGYNILPTAGSNMGMRAGPEAIAAMRKAQRANSKKYAWKGQSLCLAEIAEIEGASLKTLDRRVNESEWSLEDALAKPNGDHGKRFDGFGQKRTVAEWSDHIGCGQGFLRNALKKGFSIEQCVGNHKRITVSEFARVSGTDPNRFCARIRKGWGIGDSLVLPKREVHDPHLMKRVYK